MVGRQTGNKLAGRIQRSVPASCQSSTKDTNNQTVKQTAGPAIFKSVKKS